MWLTQEQIAALFGVKRPAITKHIRNIYAIQELEEHSVCSILERTASDGKSYMTQFYNLDMILSVGYRVNSKNAVIFRRWANSVLKEYLLKGYALNNRFVNLEDQLKEHKKILDEHSRQIDFFVGCVVGRHQVVVLDILEGAVVVGLGLVHCRAHNV